MATESDQMENADKDQTHKEVTGQLGRARALLAMAHRYAAKMPLEPDDQEKSRVALAEAIGLCVTATRAAKASNLYKMLDSGLNPSELRHCVERALSKPTSSVPSHKEQRSRPVHPPTDGLRVALFAQLDACRRLNLEGLRWLDGSEANSLDNWRGKQLLKIAEQLCVVTALESKLLGQYSLGDTRDEPAGIRKTIAIWATEATRKELAEE